MMNELKDSASLPNTNLKIPNQWPTDAQTTIH